LLEIADHSKIAKVLGEELSEPTEIFQVLANHMLSVASIAWFDGRQLKTQKDLIHDGFPFKYNLEDAERACSLFSELIGTADAAAWAVLNPELDQALKKYERQDIQVLLFEGCLQLPNISPEPRGILHENMAVVHRENHNPKLMVAEMKRAITAYRLMPNKYRLAVALKNLGEAEWMLGYPELALEYFAQAEKLTEGMTEADRANVYANLAAAAMRLKQDRLEAKYITKFLESAPDDWSGKILNASERLGVLSRRI
jgi:tetratricopeptide (TPR) repeat protein